ncbi:transcription elongation protein SprT [Fulvivirga sp. RKSG066]|nr:transcription elongation protein SprT [Fulvivirga aurantia]
MLQKHVPEAAVDYCLELWLAHPFNFKLKRPRASKLGDYRYNPNDKSHSISVNLDLNKYSFLVTYLHEVAHLLTYKEFGRKVMPHGKEWKQNFKHVALPLLSNEVFPDPMLRALAKYLKNPKASSCTDPGLYKSLSAYDTEPKLFLSDVKVGEQFVLGNRVFKKQTLRRTRYVCLEVSTGKKYLISKLAQVEAA